MYGMDFLAPVPEPLVLDVSQQAAPSPARSLIGYIVLALLLLVLVGGATYERRRRKHAMEQRQAAERGDVSRVSLAEPQPSQENVSASLSLPFTIELRPRWTRLVVLLALLAASFELAVSSVLLLSGRSVHDALLLPAAGLLVIVPWVLWTLVVDTHQSIVVSEAALTVTGSWRSGTILWRDATAFMIAAVGKRGASPVRYELSSPQSVVRWTRFRRPMPFLSLSIASMTKPTAPFDTYDQQMEALDAYIVMKTGLPLYDLRRM